MTLGTLEAARPSTAGASLDVQAGLDAVQARMMAIVDSEVDVLRDASRHIIEAGGKRVRPRLTLLSYLACGGTDFNDVISIASAIELLHTASVVHDDINDHGVLRRGRPSINAKWGRTFALLTGDYIFTKVYELVAPYSSEVNTILAEATTALVEGETLQAVAVKNRQFTREVYYRIIGLKTAALFRAAAQLGGLAAGAGERVVDALSAYGYAIGIAFQIIDDVLDVTGTTEVLGKTSGIDIAQGRGFAVAHGEDGVPADSAESQDPMVSIRAHVLGGDALQEAFHQAQRFVDEAIEFLSVLPTSDSRTELELLARSVLNRDA